MKLLLIFAVLLFVQDNFHPMFAASTTPQASADFIKTSCSTTRYPSLCNKCLSPYAPKVKKDPLKLCNAALKVSIQYAKNASNIVSLYSKQKGMPSQVTGVIKDCIENIKDSIDELKQSIKILASMKNSTDKKFQLSSIKTYASAAMTDEDTCTDELDDSEVSTSVKKKINGEIASFQQATSNALSLINHLNF